MNEPNPLSLTPAEVAAAVLAGIADAPESFDMDYWMCGYGGWGDAIEPGDSLCGTTLCAAGWAAHVTGWTLVVAEQRVRIISRDGNGRTRECWTRMYAEKGGERRTIGEVGRDALGLTDGETFWYEGEWIALARLRDIAGQVPASRVTDRSEGERVAAEMRRIPGMVPIGERVEGE